jgi:hypothetical protein
MKTPPRVSFIPPPTFSYPCDPPDRVGILVISYATSKTVPERHVGAGVGSTCAKLSQIIVCFPCLPTRPSRSILSVRQVRPRAGNPRAMC